MYNLLPFPLRAFGYDKKNEKDGSRRLLFEVTGALNAAAQSKQFSIFFCKTMKKEFINKTLLDFGHKLQRQNVTRHAR